MMKNGMRLGDIKPAALSAFEKWSATFKGNYSREDEKPNAIPIARSPPMNFNV
jgi:hypothetical protein